MEDYIALDQNQSLLTSVRTMLTPSGLAPPPEKRIRFKENNGNSFMFFTLVVGAIGPCMIVMVQQAPCLATKIIYTIFAALAALFAALNFVLLAFREWNQQLVEISPRLLITAMPVFLADIPWRIWRVTDCVLAWVLANSYLIYAFYVWDDSPFKDKYFFFCLDHTACKNSWAVWNACISQAVAYFTAATNELLVRSPLAITLTWVLSLLAWFVSQLVTVAVIAKALELLNIVPGTGAGSEGGAESPVCEADRRNIERAVNMILVELAKRRVGSANFDDVGMHRRRPHQRHQSRAEPPLPGFYHEADF
jgi:hypothetical protein